jgi:hypothetical protein
MPTFTPSLAARTLLAVALLALGGGCRRTEAEYQKLVEENAYLRSEVERLKRRGVEEKTEEKEGQLLGTPDLAATLVDLWSQRFDDNEFRAKQRLSNKVIRLTGAVDGIDADSIVLAGVSKRFGGVRMTVHLSSGYALRIAQGLAALERGAAVTVQGRFNYERMILNEAIFVEQSTGRTLYSDDLLSLSAGVSISGVVKSAPATPPPAGTAAGALPPAGAPGATPAPK